MSRINQASRTGASLTPLARLVVLALVVWLGATSVSALRPGQTQVGRDASSAEAGVYTSAQAQRGHGSYLNYCASCHRDDLTGFSTIPPLKGDAFLKSWTGRTVDDLYSFVRSSMPPYNSTPIARQVYLDIVAFILQSNSRPPGTEELVPDGRQLQALVVPKDDSVK